MRKRINEYLKTLSDDANDEDEYFMTPRAFARWQIEPYLDWCDKQKDREANALCLGFIIPIFIAVAVFFGGCAKGGWIVGLLDLYHVQGILVGVYVITAFIAYAWMSNGD